MITLGGTGFKALLPGALYENTELTAKVDGKVFYLRWSQAHQMFFVKDAEVPMLERCLRIRHFQVVSHEDGRRVRFEVLNAGTTRADAEVQALSRSRSTRKVRTNLGSNEAQISPLTGVVTKLYVKTGQVVHRGEQVAIIEAMKMENKIVSDVTGIVNKIGIVEQGKVSMGEEMFSTRPLEVRSSHA